MSYYIIEALHKLELLTEDLASFKQLVLKRYPKANLTDEILDRLISLDPTFEKGSNNKGNYADWIIKLYANNNLKEDDFYEVTQYLSDFNKKKSNFVNKDINQFKTLPDLARALEEIGLTHRQEVRGRQKARRYADLGKDAELVYEDDKFEVWIPKTYPASCKLGLGTSWCTASTESDRPFQRHTKEGPLFIFISKKDPKEKYQFHFESKQFKDRYNEEIDWDDWDIHYLEKIFKQILNGKYAHYFATEAVIPSGERTVKKGVVNLLFVEKVIIPNGVIKIEEFAFYECRSLKSITIPNSVTSIGKYAFYYCESLQSITIPDSVTSIEEHVFAHCESLQSITIPDSVTSIGRDAFYYCKSLQSITIPNSVISIGKDAFLFCDSLQSITIFNGVTSIGDGAFAHCKSLQSITIPDSVTKIGEVAFYGCKSLKSITIPNSVTYIGDKAFAYCESLKSITIPNSVTSIGYNTFDSCQSLESITIPDSVTSIKYNAFVDCTSLQSIKTQKGSYAEQYAKENSIPVEYI